MSNLPYEYDTYLMINNDDDYTTTTTTTITTTTGLKITAGQRTMCGLIADLTGQTLVCSVILTGHFWMLVA